MPASRAKPPFVPTTDALQAMIFLDDEDRFGGSAVHEYLLRYLLHEGVAGATLFSATMGFGAGHHLQRPRRFGGTDQAPLVLVYVDTEAVVRRTLEHVREVVGAGKVVLTRAEWC